MHCSKCHKPFADGDRIVIPIYFRHAKGGSPHVAPDERNPEHEACSVAAKASRKSKGDAAETT